MQRTCPDEETGGKTLNATLVKILATGFGSGYAPLAPGTVGTLVGIPFFLLFSPFGGSMYLLTILALTFLACYVADEAERVFGRKDASCIVIDEIVGYLWTMFLVSPTLPHIALGVVLFRVFDIIKPFPVRFCESYFPGGYGVVMDDVAAGLYACLAMHVILTIGRF